MVPKGGLITGMLWGRARPVGTRDCSRLASYDWPCTSQHVCWAEALGLGVWGGSKWNLQPLEEGKTHRENADTHRDGENTAGSRVVKSGTSTIGTGDSSMDRMKPRGPR